MLPAPHFFYRRWRWWLIWGLITAVGCLLLGRWQLNQLRDAFETDARIAHRLLSQRAAQHDAVMAMPTPRPRPTCWPTTRPTLAPHAAQ